MKTSLLFTFSLMTATVSGQGQALGTASGPALPTPTPYTAVSRDANSAVWQRQTYDQAPNGTIVTNIQSYTEIASGLNHLVNGQYMPSTENIVISPDGSSAMATNGQNQVYFPGNIYSGVVKLVTPEGEILESQPIGLAYSDGTNSVLLAAVTNSTGAILPSGNQVIYTNAFSGLHAELRYTYTKAGIEQDVVIQQQPPDPASLNMSSTSTRLQMLTEFISAPQPSVAAAAIPTAAGNLEDDTISFGVMQMMRGRAFLLGTNTPATGVEKRWLTLNGRQFLIEEVPIVSIAKAIDGLPPYIAQAGTGVKPVVSKNLIVPPQRLVHVSPKSRFLAEATAPSRGLVLDYITMVSQTNYTFRGDTTYYVSGTVNLSGTNTFEGDAVIKYTNGATINMSGASLPLVINWLASPYRPVIITSKDDNTVGGTISGSTGSPTNFYANPALEIQSASAQTLSNFRIAYASQAISVANNSAVSLYNGQLVNCQNAITLADSPIYLRNVLFANVATNFNETATGTVDVQNGTFNNIGYLTAESADNALTLNLTNCVLADVTNLFAGAYTNVPNACTNGFYNCPEFGTGQITNSAYPFQAVEGGNYYLASGCVFTNGGTMNIDPVLLSNLQTRTVYAPAVIQTNWTTSGSWTPLVQRDTNSSPALGYHYAPIDYLVDGVNPGSSLTLSGGVAVAIFPGGYNGFYVGQTATLTSVGTATAQNQICYYAAVQENPWGSATGVNLVNTYGFYGYPGANYPAYFTARFTDFNGCGGLGHLVQSYLTQFSLKDCQVGPGNFQIDLYSSGSEPFINNLFERTAIAFSNNSGTAAFGFYNNLVRYGSLSFSLYMSSTWQVENNLFDTTTISQNIYGSGFSEDHNGYLNTSQMTPTNANDVVMTNFTYASGPLGNYYQVSTNLLNKGSTTAGALGLYHYTVQTNLVGGYEVVEGNNTVSIGLHYVATDAYGNPLDSNGDGIPDYLEDANGDGVVNSGETNWALAILVQPVNLLANVGNSPSFSVTADGIAPIQYQWYFSSGAVLNATNATLTLSNVQTNNAGNYYVIVSNNFGAITSSVATLTVATLTITNPANNSVFAGSPTNITIQAMASVTAGTISQVQFFQGTNSLGIITSAPYKLVWSNATTGNYALNAVLVDSGLTATSSVVNITISPLFATNTALLWLKADAITGVANNAPIGTWSDSSGRGNDATQTTSGSKPLYETNMIDGLPAVQFSAASSQCFNLPNLLNGTTGAEAFVILKAAVAVPSDYRGLWYFGPDYTLYPRTDGTIYDSLGSTAGRNIGLPAPPLTQFQLYNVGGQNGQWAARLDGLVQGSSTNNVYGYTTSPKLGLSISKYFDGDIAELLVFNRMLSSAERTTINNYLNSKYGLTTSAPAAPTNLVADAISSNQIGLTWSFNLGTNDTSFEIERATSISGPFTVVAQVDNALSYVDTNLAAGTTYYYEAAAQNSAGVSSNSNEAQATTLTSGMSLPLGNLALWLKADSGIVLQGTNYNIGTWLDQSGAENNGTQLTGSAQPLWVSGAINGLPVVQFSAAGSKYFNLPNLLNGTTGSEVFVVLKAAVAMPSTYRGLWGFGSDYSFYPRPDETVYEGFGSTSGRSIGTPAQPLTQYHVYEVAGQTNYWAAWLNGVMQANITNNTYGFSTSPQLGYSRGYYFDGNIAELLVFNRNLTASERLTVNLYLNGKYALVPTVPAAPTNLTANAFSPTQIGLTWNEVLTNGGATQISIERSTNSSGPFTAIAQVNNTLSYVDTNLASATTYYYQVRAINLTQWSPYSSQAQATTFTNGMNLPFGDLLLWLKADSGVAEIGTNTSVNFWSDQSGGYNHATQTAGASVEPLWVAGALNGMPVMKFSAASSQNFNLPNLLSGTTGAEVFVVLKAAVALPSTYRGLWSFGTDYSFYPRPDGTIYESFGSAPGRNIGVPAQPLTQYHLYAVAGQANCWAAWVNGLLQGNATNNSYAFVTSPKLGVNSTYYFDGNIAELLIFNRQLSGDEQDAVGSYLISKYNLSQYAENTSPPTAPTNLIATGVAPYQLNLKWLANSTNAISFHVERKLGAGGSYQEIGSVPSNLTNFLDTTAIASNQYFYYVKAHSWYGGDSPGSIVISPPTVSLTNWPVPALENTNNLIGAQAADAYGTITSVGFFVGMANTNFLFGTATSAPYAVNWVPTVDGTWSLSALATDSLGNSQFSMPVPVSVYLSSNTNGIPDYLLVEQGNNPLNPWIAPGGDTNTTPPTIDLVVPANATLLP